MLDYVIKMIQKFSLASSWFVIGALQFVLIRITLAASLLLWLPGTKPCRSMCLSFLCEHYNYKNYNGLLCVFLWSHCLVFPPLITSLLWLHSRECEGSAETERWAEGSSGAHGGADCLPWWADCHWPGGTSTAYQRQCFEWHQWAHYLYVADLAWAVLGQLGCQFYGQLVNDNQQGSTGREKCHKKTWSVELSPKHTFWINVAKCSLYR